MSLGGGARDARSLGVLIPPWSYVGQFRVEHFFFQRHEIHQCPEPLVVLRDESIVSNRNVAAGHDVGTAPHKKPLVMAEASTQRLTEIFTTEFGFPEEVSELVSTAALRVRGE